MTPPPSDQGLLALDDHLCFSLYAASMAVSRVYKPLLDRLGITYPQYLALHALWENDGCTISAIARRLSLEPSTVTPLVKRMEAAGLVSRRRDTVDERRVHVHLTDTGWALGHRCRCLSDTMVASSGMSMDQIKALNEQIVSLRNALVQQAGIQAA